VTNARTTKVAATISLVATTIAQILTIFIN